MRRLLACLLVVSLNAGCVVVPAPDRSYASNCYVSTDRQTLKVIDVAKETNSYYSINGLILTPILLPTTAVISGTYVAAHNFYQIGKETFYCE